MRAGGCGSETVTTKKILVRVDGARGTNKQTLLILVSQFSSVDRDE